MKRRLLKIAMFNIRMMAIAMVLILPGLLIVSAKAERFYMELWKELGITQQEGRARIKEGFIYGFLYEGGITNLKNIITGDKIAVAKDLLAYTKNYVNSKEFKEDYAEYRAAIRPLFHMIPPTEAAVRKRYVDAVKIQMSEIREDMKRTEGATKQIYQDQYELLARQVKDFEDPNSKTIAYIMENEAQQFSAAMNYYCEQVTKWETEYPEDPKLFIKSRLNKFLQETKDVDYSAAVVKYHGVKHFANNSYDVKPNSWKYAFYAGKQVTQTVRTFAVGWLNEI